MAGFTDLGEAFSEEALNKANAEVSQGYRDVTIKNFRGSPSFEVRIKFPTIEADAEASKVYSKTMSELLMSKDSIVTKVEMEKKLAERGIWGKDQEGEIESLDDRILSLMREGQEMHSQKAVNKERLDQIKKEYVELKDKKNKMLSQRETFMSSTVEGMSDVAALEYKLFKCAEDMSGNKLWATYDDFRKEHNRAAVVDLLQKAMIFWSGLPQGVLDVLPRDLVFGEPDSEPLQENPSGS